MIDDKIHEIIYTLNHGSLTDRAKAYTDHVDSLLKEYYRLETVNKRLCEAEERFEQQLDDLRGLRDALYACGWHKGSGAPTG